MQVSSGRPGWSRRLFVGSLHARSVLIRASEGLEGARGMDVRVIPSDGRCKMSLRGREGFYGEVAD